MKSWKPVLRGEIYCSPACGYGCLRSDFLQATAAAKKLCTRLGEGFRPEIWENGDWHYEATNGVVRVRPSDEGFNATCDNSIWGKADTPKGAVRQLAEECEARLEHYQHLVVSIRNGKPKEAS